MPYLALKLPPGIVRPGTKYDARDRWFDANLVRWGEDAMRAVGGWQPLQRTADVAAAAAISDDGGAFTNETTDFNDVGASDVTFLPANSAINDAFYFGYSFRFGGVKVDIASASGGATLAWEYWNGSAWVALAGLVDNSMNFTVGGLSSVTWAVPANWVKNTVNSQGPFYYVRARVTAAIANTSSTGSQGFIGAGPVDVDEVVRGMFAWRSNDQTPHLFLGTPTLAYVYAGGVLLDVTPAGFTTGQIDASSASGAYGAGAYGIGPYGVGDSGQQVNTEANTWQVDNYGEDLVTVAYSDGKLWYWDKSAGGDLTQTPVGTPPTGNKAVVVTPERFIFLLGAGGDGRKVQWSDQDDITIWTASATNQAGDVILPGKGQLLSGRRGRNETLLWTDVDFFVARFSGGEFIYEFRQLGSQCGPISRRSMSVVDAVAFWMGRRGFWVYDGIVKPVLSDVVDYVFSDLNTTQVSKIHSATLTEVGEVWWYYPSGGSTEIDRYVVYNYRENFWDIGKLQRTSAVDRDAFSSPLAADALGTVYDHETGTGYLDQNGVALVPFAESGPIELTPGDNVMAATEWVPDEKTLGDVQVSLYSSFYPTAPETLFGPFAANNPTSLRVTGRQVRVRATQVRPNWRYGTPRLMVTPDGMR